MRTLVIAALLLVTAGPARAAIIGLIEAPETDASEISNVQGWVYTNTPGATLIQPFEVLINGEAVMNVPCCSDRGDVQDLNPDAPLETGFSGVTNWAREADGGPMTVQVVVRDTAGGLEVLTNTPVTPYAAASFPFSSHAQWSNAAAPATALGDEPQGSSNPRTSWCSLSNDGPDDTAELICTGLVSTQAGGADMERCYGTHRFTWVRASQGFRLRSNCEDTPRWEDHGDGTATDRWSGLRWELFTPANVNVMYPWSSSGIPPDGGAFFFKAGQANGSGGAGCYADFCDWRVPTIQELSEIVDQAGCFTDPESPCTTIPGETAEAEYWASTTSNLDNTRAWVVDFDSGGFGDASKSASRRVRLVRGAPPVVADAP